MTYQLFDTELKMVSMLTGQAVAFFSVGSFLSGCVLNVLVGYAFSDPKSVPVAGMALIQISPMVAVCALVFFGLGWNALRKKDSILKQIHRETNTAVGSTPASDRKIP